MIAADFRYACAYCSISQREAEGISFENDHYMPQKGRWQKEPAWLQGYENRVYACHVCNRTKSDWEPTEAEACDGLRLLKSDEDVVGDHLKTNCDNLQALSGIGETTIDELCLNDRRALKKLRQLRRQFWSLDTIVLEGVGVLLDVKLTSLPQR